jgi:sporulation related protein
MSESRLLAGEQEVELRIAGERARARLLMGGALAAVMTVGMLAAPAQAGSAGWEAILGGHLRSQAAATKVAKQARAKGFKVYVQKISAGNWEAEIFNGGRSRSQAEAVCARARRVGGLAHCSVEQEFHGNHWG